MDTLKANGDADNLTPKQQVFVREYLVDLNATQAAVRAGYSERSAAERGYELRQKPSVAAAIEVGMTDRGRRTDWTADKVLLELGVIAMNLEEKTADRLNAFNQIGRHLGMYTDNVNLGAAGELKSVLDAIDGKSRGLPSERAKKQDEEED